MLSTAFGSGDVVRIVSIQADPPPEFAGEIEIENCCVAVVPLPVVTITVKLNAPGAVGDPVSSPTVLKESPAGKAVVAVHVNGLAHCVCVSMSLSK
jgi:hypothetical protein